MNRKGAKDAKKRGRDRGQRAEGKEHSAESMGQSGEREEDD